MALKLLQNESERACDDLVLAAGSQPDDYAQHILEIASTLQSGMLASHSGIAMARKSKLEGRLLAILDGKRNRRRLTVIGILVAAAIVAGIVVPISILKATDSDNQKVAGLIEQLNSEDENTWKPAVAELIKIGPVVAEPVSRLLQGAPGDAHALKVLEAMARDSDVQALMRKAIDSANRLPERQRCSLLADCPGQIRQSRARQGNRAAAGGEHHCRVRRTERARRGRGIQSPSCRIEQSQR